MCPTYAEDMRDRSHLAPENPVPCRRTAGAQKPCATPSAAVRCPAARCRRAASPGARRAARDAVTSRSTSTASAAARAASSPKLCTSSWPCEVSTAPSDAGAEPRRASCSRPTARLCTATRPVCRPGSGDSCGGSPVTRGSSIRCSRAAPVSAACSSARRTASSDAARSKPSKPAVPRKRPVDQRRRRASPPSARAPRPRRAGSTARSRCASAGPTTRNDTGACSIRGSGSSPASDRSPASTVPSSASPRASAGW